MNCIKFISKLFAPKESQIPYYSPSKVLSMDPRKTTTQQRKKARLEMKQRHFNYYNNERARRCIEPITYDEYNKMLKLKELSEEKYIESSENNRMSFFDKKKNNNQKELLFKNYDPMDEFAGETEQSCRDLERLAIVKKKREEDRLKIEAQRKHEEYMRRTAAGETEQGRRDLERLAIVRKRREEDRLKREAEGRAPGWTPNGVASSSDDSDDDKPIANPPANNPNLVKKTGEEMIKAKDLVSIDGPTGEFAGMNRKERESVEAQRKYTEYMRRTIEQGRRDLERLAIVRKRREEDRLKREAEGRAPGWTPNGVASSSDDSDDDKPIANPPANNPNLEKTGEKMIKAKDLASMDGPTDEFAEMNRKERESVEEQRKYEEYVRRTIEQSHRDLERLAAIRKKREEDRLKREAEGRAPGWTPNGVASSSDDDKPIANNPNLVKKTGEKIKKVRFCSMDGPTDEFAGMNREAVEAQRKYTEYMRRTAADKTDKGRRDFERLTYIRKKRGLAPGWTLYEIDSDVSDIDSDVSDIDSDVADIDSDVSDDEIKESKLFNKISSTLIQNIPNYSENTNLLWLHNKKFHTDYYRL